MNIKYFNDASGLWENITGNVGDGLTIGTDGWVVGKAYDKIVLNITQTSTSDPVLTIFENTTNANLSSLYISLAHYELNADAAIFVENQLWIIFNNNLITQFSGYNYQAIYNSSTKLDLYSYINGVATDGAMQNTSLEIRIYPTAP